MRTEIGEFLKKIRISRGNIFLRDMASKLEVTSSFLSAVECGKKKFPNDWFIKLKEIYNLNDKEIKDMREAVAETNKMVEINLENLPLSSKKLAISFARNLDYIDKETADFIIAHLNKALGGK